MRIQIRTEPIRYYLPLSRKAGHSAKAKKNRKMMFAKGISISKLSQPGNPALLVIFQNGQMTRTKVTISIKQVRG
jgi:hypothetical protein